MDQPITGFHLRDEQHRAAEPRSLSPRRWVHASRTRLRAASLGLLGRVRAAGKRDVLGASGQPGHAGSAL